jgi:predicted metal-dependent hydrolase
MDAIAAPPSSPIRMATLSPHRAPHHDAGRGVEQTIRPRSPRFDFEEVPRRWFAGSTIGTAFANGLNLLFPAGERFFVRSVRHYLDRIEDPQLREDVKGFSGQEGLHAYAHERQFEALEKQGYAIRPFLRFYEAFAYGFVEKIAPAQLCLAATAACEHFTATMATNALARETEGVFVLKDPTMRALLLWHAVEEIEHRSVAFDVLAEINPSFELRVAGLAVATSMLFSLWMLGAGTLLVQDRATVKRWSRELRARREFRAKHKMPAFGPAIRAYLRRDFHPSDDTACDELARAYAARAGLT